MDINNELYIYYIGENNKNNIKLRDHRKLLKECENNRNEENKKKLLKNFRKKFSRDFIKSSKKLIDDNNLYPALIILLSGIDVLAKHYNGNTTTRSIGKNYKLFMQKVMHIEKELSEDIYNNFRCSLIHSGSTPVSFTISENIREIVRDNGKIIIELKYFFGEVLKSFQSYLKLIKKNEKFFNKFLAVQKELYKEI